jgi:two-component system sensor histidine kinase TctE
MGVIALATVVVVQRATRSVRKLGEAIEQRPADDLSPIDAPDAPRELRPLIDATTQVMGRLQQLLDHQKRFVRDSAHQLRTPLAVLKAQVQSARRGDVAPEQAFGEISQTVERATALANQMLSLAKVEQLRQQPESMTLDFGEVVRQIALDLSPLVADKALDFELAIERPVPVQAHQWMLQELTRNLLHNAIKHSSAGGALSVSVRPEGGEAVLTVRDGGPGISPELRQRLFAPFAAGSSSSGSGLGLAICREIVLALGGRIALDNRGNHDTAASTTQDGDARVVGLDAVVRLPLALPVSRHNS